MSQHTQPTQQVVCCLPHGMCSHSVALSRHMSNGQSVVPLPEPAEPTSSSSVFSSSLLVPSCLEIGPMVLGSCGFSELLFGTAGPPHERYQNACSDDCMIDNHEYMIDNHEYMIEIDNHDYMIAHRDCGDA